MEKTKKKKQKTRKVEGGKKRVSRKKINKYHQMWIEQILYKIDDINARIDKLEKTVRLIRQELESNR